ETSAVRIGIPNRLGGLMEEYRRPEYATATGLLLMHAEKNKLEDGHHHKRHHHDGKGKDKNSVKNKISNFFKEFF
ncbi:MAG: cell division protein FtsA, partial [Treponemataceae bacterium]